jgi:hypothetical protein
MRTVTLLAECYCGLDVAVTFLSGLIPGTRVDGRCDFCGTVMELRVPKSTVLIEGFGLLDVEL